MSKFEDWGNGEGDDHEPASAEPEFVPSETARCLRCFPVVRKRTAQLVYMTVRWNVYYCGRCRGWFRSLYKSRYIVEPIEDKQIIRSLVKQYMRDQEMISDIQRLRRWVSRMLQMTKEFFYGVIARKAQNGDE